MTVPGLIVGIDRLKRIFLLQKCFSPRSVDAKTFLNFEEATQTDLNLKNFFIKVPLFTPIVLHFFW